MNRQSNQQYRTSPSCCPLVSHRQQTRPIRVAYARPLCANMTSSTNRKCIAYCIVVLSVLNPSVQYVLVLSGRIVMHGIRCDLLLIHPLCAKRRRRGLMAYVLLLFLVISVRPIISTSSGPIFPKFAGLVDLWPYLNNLKLFFSIPEGTLLNQFCGQNRLAPLTLYFDDIR